MRRDVVRRTRNNEVTGKSGVYPARFFPCCLRLLRTTLHYKEDLSGWFERSVGKYSERKYILFILEASTILIMDEGGNA